MPNHVSHIAKFEGEQSKINELLAKISTREIDVNGNEIIRHIDFNKIIPQPEDLYLGDLTEEMRRKTKGRNWYDWNIANWGTKWNAYDTARDGNTITFDTAWSSPSPVIRELHVLCKDAGVTCEITYADENIGYNTGIYRIGGDKYTHTMYDDCSLEALAAYRETHEGWEDDYILNADGTMSNKEE